MAVFVSGEVQGRVVGRRRRAVGRGRVAGGAVEMNETGELNETGRIIYCTAFGQVTVYKPAVYS
ncbi:hypothetical protein QMP25_18230 [Enterocloster clostridioformis]